MAQQLRVFVSHSHKDDDFCRPLVATLREAGADVWYDEHNMGSGQLGPTIERELRSRPIFLVILSEAALNSSWVEDETRWAYMLYRKDRTRVIQPILASSVDEESIWLFLQDFKRIEAQGIKPYSVAEAARRTLHALGLDTSRPSIPPVHDTAEELVTRGRALYAQGKWIEAAPILRRATELDHTSIDAWESLAHVLLTIDLNPSDPFVQGFATEETLAVLDQVIALDPTNAASWSMKAQALCGFRSHDSIVAAEHAISLDPTLADAWLWKSAALSALGRHKDAEKARERANSLREK